MQLTQYPDAIAQSERAHLASQQQVRDLSAQLEARKAQFSEIVANDAALTNEAKRKAARAELELTDTDYLNLQQRLLMAKDGATEAVIEVGRLSNLFRVERLLMEEKIAGMRGAISS